MSVVVLQSTVKVNISAYLKTRPSRCALKGRKFSLSFSKEVAKMLRIVLQYIFRHDFLSPHTTIVPGVKNFPSASISCYSVDLAQLLLCLDL